MNLNEILYNVDKIVEEGLELPEELDKDLKDKVDAYVWRMDQIEMEIEYLKKKKAVKENDLARLKDWAKRNMEAFGWLEIKGQDRKLKLVNQERFTILRDPTPNDQHIKLEPVWDKETLKQLGEVEGICTLKKSFHVRRG